MRIRSKSLSLTLVLTSVRLLAQPGAIDPTFNPDDLGFGYGDGANSTVYTTALQPDGKIIIGGDFTSYNATGRQRITRLNADGDPDITFGGMAPNGSVKTAALQPDGKIIIGGGFTSHGTTSRNRIARLNADGTLDTTFDPGTGATWDLVGSVDAIVLQPDGKIIIAGHFNSYNGTPRPRIARLNADGSVDNTYIPGIVTNSSIFTSVLQPDGKIIVGGDYTSFGTTHNRIDRLNTDGSIDATFDPGTGANAYIYASALQPDGKIIIGGQFISYNGTAINRIARLNMDGSLDTSFDPGTGADGFIGTITLLPNGKMIIGGGFTSYNGAAKNRIARLNSDGSLDAGFNIGTGASSTISTTVVQADGKIIIGGAFTSYDGPSSNRIARLNANGSIDATFNSSAGANDWVYTSSVQPDGKIIIGGGFTSYNNTVRGRIARLHTDGALDIAFSTGSGANATIAASALQTDGKIIIAGNFTSYNGTARGCIARLNSDGSLDATFNPPSATPMVATVTLQPDGKIIIGGSFTNYAGTGRNRIARLNADGSLDLSFTPGSGANSIVRTAVLQPDGKMIIGGDLTNYNGAAVSYLTRLNADGSLDGTFNSPMLFNYIDAVAVQPDGKIIIGGLAKFTRLNADGSQDTSFDLGTGLNGGTPLVVSMLIQPDGKIIIGGNFNVYNGTTINRIARVNTNGSLDPTFNPGTGLSTMIETFALQADGKIIIGGRFTSYNGTGRNRIARLEGDPSIAVHVKVHLEGAYSSTTGLMSDALRVAGLVPLAEPYTALGYSFAGGGGESTTAPVLAVSGNDAIVDWALVELRSDAVPATVLASKSALLQRDGDVVGTDGISPVRFTQPAGTYRIAIRHRNHLGAMTLNGVALSNAPTTVDLTTGGTATYGTAARKSITGTFPAQVLWAGDVTFNGQIKYAGGGNDRDPILVRIGGLVPTATTNGYWGEDVNMNGLVKYAGASNDRDPILSNIGGSTPTSVRSAQLP